MQPWWPFKRFGDSKVLDADLQRMDRFAQELGLKMSSQAGEKSELPWGADGVGPCHSIPTAEGREEFADCGRAVWTSDRGIESCWGGNQNAKMPKQFEITYYENITCIVIASMNKQPKPDFLWAGCSWPDGQGDSGHQSKLTSIFWRVKSTNLEDLKKDAEGARKELPMEPIAHGLKMPAEPIAAALLGGWNRHRWMVWSSLASEVQSLQLSDIDSQRWELFRVNQGDGKQSITRCWELECFGISVRWNWRSRIETVESKLNEFQVPCVFFCHRNVARLWSLRCLRNFKSCMIWRVSSDSCATWKRLWMHISCRQGWFWAYKCTV